MNAKIEALAKLVTEQHLEMLVVNKVDCECNRLNCVSKVKEGKKYTKVDVGNSGKLMIDQEGNIFGIKAYGVIHRGHQYGTLDTINDYYWGNFYPTKRVAK